jgi:hypothetical protein
MEDWLGELKAMDLETTKEDAEAVVEEWEVLNKWIKVETIGALEDPWGKASTLRAPLTPEEVDPG